MKSKSLITRFQNCKIILNRNRLSVITMNHGAQNCTSIVIPLVDNVNIKHKLEI